MSHFRILDLEHCASTIYLPNSTARAAAATHSTIQKEKFEKEAFFAAFNLKKNDHEMVMPE